jgi:NAD(P)-dependent dehydrogenase (short-subunit alcohol dehydrogenase family)
LNNGSSTVLVTGGTSGIGLALSRGFVDAGYQVMAAGLGDLPGNEERLHFFNLDVSEDAAVVALVDTFERLDVVINAAGIIRRTDELKPDVFASVVDVNLNGTMRSCAAARPLLAKSKGCIINIASMLSYFGGGLVPGYSASKGGGATDQIAGNRLRARRDSGQCTGARLDRNSNDTGIAGRRIAQQSHR